jgi:hypothetical protein
MSRSDGPGWLRNWAHAFLGICLTLLLAALALHWAVGLLEDVWVGLLVIGGIAAVLTAAVAWWRAQSRGW